jgi:DNA-directed RNA polymerase subunit RPC12/RpoP
MKCVLCNRTIQYAKDDNVAICVNCFVKIISMGWREPIKDKKYADAVTAPTSKERGLLRI